MNKIEFLNKIKPIPFVHYLYSSEEQLFKYDNYILRIRVKDITLYLNENNISTPVFKNNFNPLMYEKSFEKLYDIFKKEFRSFKIKNILK